MTADLYRTQEVASSILVSSTKLDPLAESRYTKRSGVEDWARGRSNARAVKGENRAALSATACAETSLWAGSPKETPERIWPL